MAVDQHPLLNPLILHSVLSELPQLDLLLVQRVCRTWHDAIRTSTPLQRALFLCPDLKRSEDDIRANPLLVAHFPDFFAVRSGQDWSLGPFKTTRWFATATADPPDRRLSAAYARPTASWRRMYPSRPAPTELQVVTVRDGRGPAHGRFRKSSDAAIPAAHVSPGAADGGDGMATAAAPSPRGIPFGPIYDVVQAGEFPSHGKRIGLSTHVLLAGEWLERHEGDVYGDLDLTLGQFRPEVLRPGSDGEVEEAPRDPRVRDTYRTLWYRWRRDVGRFRTALAGHDFAGGRSAVVKFINTPQCKRGGPKGFIYPADFLRSEGSVIVGAKEVANEQYDWKGIDWETDMTFEAR